MGRAANEPRWHKGQPANECLGLRRLWGLEFQHTARAIAPPLPADGLAVPVEPDPQVAQLHACAPPSFVAPAKSRFDQLGAVIQSV